MFDKALLFSMKYEVGPNFKLDTDTKAGKINTVDQQRKVGYVNDFLDNGGETKYGIAKNANPDLNIVELDWETAAKVYEQKYWLAGKCDQLPEKIAFAHFDACINHGIKQAAVLLQRALNVTEDGVIGPKTIAAVQKMNPDYLVNEMIQKRRELFKFICMKNPKQSRFLNGWLSRCDSIQKALS